MTSGSFLVPICYFKLFTLLDALTSTGWNNYVLGGVSHQSEGFVWPLHQWEAMSNNFKFMNTMLRFLYLYLALYQISSWTHEYWSQRHHIKYFDWFSLQVYLNNIKNISMELLKLLLIYFIPYSSLSYLSRWSLDR